MQQKDLDCIVIDYIQLLRADIHYQSRANEVGAISKAIKALAMELNIPIIALSQLNRVRKLEKTPSEKDRLKAAELIGKRYGLFTDKIETDVDMDLNITIDYGDE